MFKLWLNQSKSLISEAVEDAVGTYNFDDVDMYDIELEMDYDGRAPIHLASAEGHLNIIDYFIKEGLDLNPLDRWGGTPLDDAKKGNHPEIVKEQLIDFEHTIFSRAGHPLTNTMRFSLNMEY